MRGISYLKYIISVVALLIVRFSAIQTIFERDHVPNEFQECIKCIFTMLIFIQVTHLIFDIIEDWTQRKE